jgi:hypothetical protein
MNAIPIAMDFRPRNIFNKENRKTLANSIRQIVSITLLLFSVPTGADILFDGDESLTIELHAPLERLSDEKNKSMDYEGKLIHADETFDVKLEARGNKRLSKCKHPPLRVKFKKDQIDGTLFEKQDDIKLVVKCVSSSRYDNYLRKEYLVYKTMNQLTDMSYRVRWANVTYFDTESEKMRQEPAFFVERKSRVAKRLNLDRTDVVSIDVTNLDPDHAALVTLFQYVVANPDFSIIAAPPGDECCHNAKLLKGGDVYYPIIYDFDSTGVVNASYAEPADSLGIDKVTERLYRGYCKHNPQVVKAREMMIAQRESLVSRFESDPLLRSGPQKRAARFLNRSFDILESDGRFNREIIRRCR